MAQFELEDGLKEAENKRYASLKRAQAFFPPKEVSSSLGAHPH